MKIHARAGKPSSDLSKALARRGRSTFVGNGKLEGSAAVGVGISVTRGSHDWVISWKENERSGLQYFG